MAKRVPFLIEVNQIAELIGWTPRKTRAFMVDNQLSFQTATGKRHLIFRDEFEAKLPKIYALFKASL